MAASWLVNGGAPNHLLTEMILGVVGLVWLLWVGGVLFVEKKNTQPEKNG